MFQPIVDLAGATVGGYEALAIHKALAARPALHRVVVELTEHTPVHDLAALRRQCDELRGRCASFSAVDEDGIFSQVAGHAAADHNVTDITPELVHAVRDRIV